MANKKVSDLTATTSVASGDLFLMENAGGNSRKITGSNLAAGLKSLAPFKGAKAKRSSGLTSQNFATGPTITWDGEDFDTDSWHDTGSNTDRLTVPSGVTYLEATCSIAMANLTANQWVRLSIIHRNSSNVEQQRAGLLTFNDANTTPSITISTGPWAVAATDYLVAELLVESDTSSDVTAGSYFSVLALG